MVEGIADRRMQTRRRRRRREAAREEEETPRRAQLFARPIVAFVSPACRNPKANGIGILASQCERGFSIDFRVLIQVWITYSRSQNKFIKSVFLYLG